MQLMKSDKTYLNKNIRFYLFNNGRVYIDLDDDNSEQLDLLLFYNPEYESFYIIDKGAGPGWGYNDILWDKYNRDGLSRSIETIDKTFRFKGKDFIVSKLRDLIAEYTPEPKHKKSFWQRLKELF